MAFEQVGGADRALEMARDYALDRMAFGRPIGSFQAIKHKLADMYVANTLARSNAYYAAWALAAGEGELAEAAANARISATEAYRLSAAESLQTHGGIGFTWEHDCHLHYRRAHLLGGRARFAALLGKPPYRRDASTQRGLTKESPMDFDDTPEEAEFRAKARAWLEAEKPDDLLRELAAAEALNDPAGRAAGLVRASKAWQQRKFAGGWACLSWPKAFGGRGATPIERVIWDQEEGATPRCPRSSRSVRACAGRR